MSSKPFVTAGTAELLPLLRADLRRARTGLLVVCPWLDEFFAQQLVDGVRRDLAVRVVMRPAAQTDDGTWARMVAAVALLRDRFVDTRVRTLECLHAKCIVVDGATAYVGSTNFYAFSLEQSREVTIRGPIELIQGLASELERLWNAGDDLLVEPAPRARLARSGEDDGRVRQEIDDPIVARVLRKNPKAWVLGKKR